MSSSDPEVVIIGAGAAGIAAARALRSQGRSCLVLEGGPRVGGRAHSCATLGSPLDHGATWLHAADRNPLTRFATAAKNHDEVRERHVRVGERWAEPAELAAISAAEERFDAALEAARAGPDRAVSEVAPRGGPWDATVTHWLCTQIQAREAEYLSAHDQFDNGLEGPNLLLPGGIGALVAELARDLPIRLNARVTGIDWSGPGVVVRGEFGTVRAQRAIVTVSTGVLAAGGIRFTPALPPAYQQAIHGLPMALLTKFAFRCASSLGGRMGIEPFHTVRRAPQPGHEPPMGFIMWPFGRDHLFGFVGGEAAWALSRQPPAETLRVARAELEGMLGPMPLGQALVTDWGTDPLFLGSYSQALPGMAGARAVLREPLGALRFAGEATSLGLAGTIGGAWAEGEAAVA
ncbi:flavin monoamine oxidase family protein [Rhodovarius crocodyli]|nr:NAD(P)/FAD-dependent oxidoreductase [Rhodovarius crocodyli]